MKDYQQLQRRFELAGGYHYRTDLEGVLEGLGLPADLLDRPLLTTSGGELTRITLARALLADADLLLLDEPTNHLDIDSVEWLEQYLLDYPKAYVLVTHDRRLLERVGSRVLALEHGVVATIGGDFETYMRERSAANDIAARRYEQDKDKIEQLQRFYDRFHAKKLKAKQAKSKLTQIERIKKDMKAPRRDARRLHLGLPQPVPSARVVLEMKTPAVVVRVGRREPHPGAPRRRRRSSAARRSPCSAPTVRARRPWPRPSSACARWPTASPTSATTCASPTSRSRVASSTRRPPPSSRCCR